MLINFKAYDLEFTLADNDLHDPWLDRWSREIIYAGAEVPVHAYGYNGLRVLKHKRHPESIVSFAFLNLETITDGTPNKNVYEYYEPRRNPVTIYTVAEHKGILMQNPLPHWGVESLVWIQATEPHYLDVLFQFTTHRRQPDNRPLLFLVPNYIHAPEDPRMHFVIEPGAWSASDPAVTPGQTFAGSRSQLEFLQTLPQMALAPLVPGIALAEPFFFGLWRDMVLALFFEPGDALSFAVNPAGGGAGNPAWDTQFCLEQPAPYKAYDFRARLMFKPFVSAEDVQAEYRQWLAQLPS